MKRITKTAVVLMAIFSVFALLGCADAVVNDGNNIRTFGDGAGGGAIPFRSYNDVMDLQIWADNGGGATAKTEGNALIVTQTGSWWGIAICSKSNGSDDDKTARIYDLSDVAQITFEAKSPNATSMWLSLCGDACKTTCEITEEYQRFTVDLTGKEDNEHYSEHDAHYTIVCLGGESAGGTWYVRNIAFWNAEGAEITPTLVD